MNESTLTLVSSTKQLSMTHREIAEVVKSRPDNVKVSIERLAERGVIQLPATKVLEEISNLGLPIKRECYVFEGEQGRRDSIVVVAQLCPEFTAQIVDRWQELEKEKEQAQIPATPAPIMSAPVIQVNDGIVQLARVIAEATASATMKAMAGVITLPSYQTETAAPAYTRQPEGEYVPVSKAAWETGLSDSACRKLIGFFKVPVRSNGGLRGLLVNLPEMKKAAERLLRESTAPEGKRKRWSHPQFGNFTCYADLI
ncbi:Rha family transcriptional regulator [Salmonella enterica]|nr:Rha family transcriptional regulator [Salmonella enterica]EDI0748239.1 DNA-binding protein [Salmonella enterica subsp. enterica serovar Kisarawe]EHL3455308.1 Rha family transcriptional regulator [Salmonella enterica]EHL6571888.1 Rha family transcriptional regulator [Salmonella enterica]EHO7938504.1 Rha family transcriptional regulator [Salmonella enterica]EIF1892358.1 Rha family transcriptional regulator [Salmonella enterica]